MEIFLKNQSKREIRVGNPFKIFALNLLLILIFFSEITSNAIAIKYEVGVEENDEFIWKSNVCDRKKMEEIFGKDWDDDESGIFENLEEGSRMRWKIKEIKNDDEIYCEKTKNNETALKIISSKWKWTKDKEWGDKDSVDETTHFANPDDYEDDLILFNFAPIWLPLPLDEYLKKLDLYKGYSIDARVISTITIEIEKNDLEGDYPTEYIKIQAMYNDKGILNSYKLYIKDHQVIIDISLETALPYIIFILPAITAVFYIGLIYIIYKKILRV